MKRPLAIVVFALLLLAVIGILLLFAANIEENNFQQQLENTDRARKATIQMILKTNTTMVFLEPNETPRQFKTQASP
jgi:uncharacterized iron-regulated membrane protein